MKKYLYILSIYILSSTNYNNVYANDCYPPTATADLDINNVRAKLLNGGDKFWDIFGTSDAAYEIPKGSGKHSMFASAIWISSYDDGGNLYSAAQTYRQTGLDFWPGELNDMGETQEINCKEGDKMYSVYGNEIIDAKIGKGIPYNVSRWPAHIADFYDNNNDGIYDPSLGDYPLYDRLKPNLIPGQMIFWTINDMGGEHTNIPNTLRMGLEIHITAFAFPSNTSNAINNSTFYRYKILNKSANIYVDFRVGEFSDPDVGYSQDDYIGCDLSMNTMGYKRNLFYAYNGDGVDDIVGTQGYGNNPPAIGVSFLNTGFDDSGSALGIGSYIFVGPIAGQNSFPRSPLELIRNMNSTWIDGNPIMYGAADARTGNDMYRYVYPGDTDPTGKAPWYEAANVGDRKTIASTNGKVFLPGEQMTIELSYVWAQDLSANPGPRPSLELLRLTTDTVIQAYSNNFSNFTTNINQKVSRTFNVFPNPSKDVLNIDFEGSINSIVIYDISGKLIKSIKNTNTRKVDISDLDEGTYLIKVNESAVRFVKM